MENRPIDITVVMPALNEEKALRVSVESTLRSFEKHNLSGEIVIVNDGSSDSTPEIALSLKDKHIGIVRVLNHQNPMGIGRSFLDGSKLAQGKGVVMMPGDNENDPDEIMRYVNFMDTVDVVVPYVVNKEVRSVSRNIISGLFLLIINATFRTSFKYTNGTIIYKNSVLKDLNCRSGGFFFQAEMLIKIVKRGHTIEQVPYLLSKRDGGMSKALSFKSLIRVMRNYLLLVRDIYILRRY